MEDVTRMLHEVYKATCSWCFHGKPWSSNGVNSNGFPFQADASKETSGNQALPYQLFCRCSLPAKLGSPNIKRNYQDGILPDTTRSEHPIAIPISHKQGLTIAKLAFTVAPLYDC